ncbi:lysosomal cobalamin transport escort protein LMBD1-like isoform X1 [Centruroides vittatus]|uniref:lysosomal cobalamin transport escort protein LMBD1-like isoform X1 n=1 Tax=Centruroides vittatus TaxID=120091 RepID=UPI00351088A0
MASFIPVDVNVSAWIPFAILIIVTLLFSGGYVRYFRCKYDSEMSSTVTAVLGLAIVVLTALLIPVDIFYVSFMKTSNGTFKDWASNATVRDDAENSVLYAYYTMYSLVLCFAFFILPFIYFYYEERDDDGNNIASRICAALKYTLVFIFVAVVLILIGLFAPLKDEPPRNSTEWEKLKFLFTEIGISRGEQSISFILNILTSIGTVTLVLYTGIGLPTWPIDMIKGSRNVIKEHEAVIEERKNTENEIDFLRKKRSQKKLSSRESSTLSELEETQHLIERQERYLDEERHSWTYKFRFLIRPLQIVFGILGASLGFLIWLSLLLTNIDKLIHSMGYKIGYMLSEPSIPNPVDFVLVQSQKVFPIDYIIFAAITLFLIIITISGIQKLGLWFFCVKMYTIRVKRTRPQGLLMLCLTLMYTVLGINILLFNISPQYMLYGSQHYVANVTEGNATVFKIKPCSTVAPSDECVMTRVSYLLFEFIYRAWFFGVIYYWSSWAFLLMSVIGFFVAIIQRKKSSIAGLVDRDDFEESDDELIRG